jgi:predicted dienelactone hydrolase
MVRSNHLLTLLVLAALLLSACQPIQPMAEREPRSQPVAEITGAIADSPRFDAPPYAVAGPYAVGLRDFVVAPAREGERPLTVSVWYPALNPEGLAATTTYLMSFPAGEYALFTLAGQALVDAAPAAADAPYPLVVYSHGAYMFRQSIAYLTEHLASQGMVVIAPDHEDNWGNFGGPLESSEISRSADLRRTLDFAQELTAPGGPLAGLIDMDHVAAAGYAFGSYIALQLGGARLNLDEFFVWCKEEDDPHADCIYMESVDKLAHLAGLQDPPVGLWPDWRDERVDAVVMLGTTVHLLGFSGTQQVRVPTLALIGTLDELSWPAFDHFDFYQRLPSARKTQVLFENANHFIFLPTCAAMPDFVKMGFAWACTDAVWDLARTHDLTNHFVTAFLLAELKGDAEAAKALAPENVTFPGIQYETTAYGQ